MESDVDLEAMPTARRHLSGYPSFAEFIAKDKDAAIYRCFENLSARSLLYQQSELHELEQKLEDLDREDAKDIDNEKRSRLRDCGRIILRTQAIKDARGERCRLRSR